MQRTAFLFLALLAVGITSAQTLEHSWTRRVGSQNDNDKLWATAVDGQGNVYATGVLNGTFSEQGTSVTSIGLEDILLVKYDANGSLLWARVAGGPSIDNAYGITCDAVGNVYITGFYVDFAVFEDTLIATGDPNNAVLPFHFVARFTPDGDLAWVRSAEATWTGFFGPACIGNDIELDNEGDLVVAGLYFSPNESVDPGFSLLRVDTARFRTVPTVSANSVFVQKLDTAGHTLWLHTIGGYNGFGRLKCIDIDKQNNIWTGGVDEVSSDFVSGPVQLTNTVINDGPGLVYVLSPDGEPLSGFDVNTSLLSSVEDLEVADNGDVILAGFYRGTLNGTNAATLDDGFVMRTSSSGTPLWTDHLAGVGGDFATCITQTQQANELVIGAYYFFQASLAGTALDQNAGNNSALVRLDTLGNLIEVLQPDPLSGSTFIADVQSDGQGALYLCGDVNGEVAFTNDTILCLSQDSYLSKVEPIISTSTGPDPVSSAFTWQLFPNPASDHAQVILDPRQNLPTSIVLRDALGRELRRTIPTSDRFIIDLLGLETGAFRVEMIFADRRESRTLVLVKN
ncbi:MAG: hypothetical protein IPK99_17120 [Flavobacteriales bacterium]|nr:hypothetical protein [Flavobacteriales bacterium]